MLSAAAVLAIVALGSWNLVLQANRGTSHSAALADQLVAALASGAHVTHIAGTASYPAANAALVQPRAGSAYLLVDGLSPAPAQKVYELWLVKPRVAPRSAGVFSVSSSQPLVYRLSIAATGYAVAAVTVEPMPDGSKGPTGAKVLAGSIST
jgi:anti-sigma-K factor RskA